MKEFLVCLDYGHGGRDPGAVYRGRKESMDNLRLGSRIAKELRNKGVKVDEVRKDDSWISLNNRVQFANKKNYDFFLSFHRNAFRPEIANGVEVFVHPKSSVNAGILGVDILKSLEKLGFKNRGLKKKSFYVLSKTKAPALLLEIGFIDNTQDNYLFDKKLENIVESISLEIKKKARLV